MFIFASVLAARISSNFGRLIFTECFAGKAEMMSNFSCLLMLKGLSSSGFVTESLERTPFAFQSSSMSNSLTM